eukprot:GHRR01001692.1.p1 GENE.GHRR01001692.1~~GHRR01001692.1.p1  ORF type:complete len:205 (-),score=29.51 GHRR01001692.1:2489-3103(-)
MLCNPTADIAMTCDVVHEGRPLWYKTYGGNSQKLAYTMQTCACQPPQHPKPSWQRRQQWQPHHVGRPSEYVYGACMHQQLSGLLQRFALQDNQSWMPCYGDVHEYIGVAQTVYMPLQQTTRRSLPISWAELNRCCEEELPLIAPLVLCFCTQYSEQTVWPTKPGLQTNRTCKSDAGIAAAPYSMQHGLPTVCQANTQIALPPSS